MRIVAKVSAAVLIVMSLLPAIAPTPVSAATGFVSRVNFQQATWPVPAGYAADSGLGFDPLRTYGWVTSGTQTPLDLDPTAAKRRLSVGDARLGSLIAVPTTVMTQWQQKVPNGNYDVTVSVGDRYSNNKSTVTVEGLPAVTAFKPTSTRQYERATVRVNVADTFLTLDFTGSTNAPLNYVEIVRVVSGAPLITSITPADAASNVDVTTSVTLINSVDVDPATLSSATVQIIDLLGNPVQANINTDAAGGTISITPQNRLAPYTSYQVETNAGLKDRTGKTFRTVTTSFTTGEGGIAASPGSFDRAPLTSLAAPSVMQVGPDGRLYVATGGGELHAFTLGTNPGTGFPVVTADQSIGPWAGARTILGLAFDPRSTAASPVLWVSHGAIGDLQANYTGTISLVSGPGLTSVRDVVIGLPRSCHDHMNNGITFGPDGNLYLAQGAMTGYGAPDTYWCNRGETQLAASIMQMDVQHDSRFASTVDVNTSSTNSTGTPYNPAASNAPVKIYAKGTRNPYSLVWHSNGTLYAPVNESSGGNAPAGPGGVPPALTNLPDFPDYLAKVQAGGYYGHPNPSQGTYTLNGGNPTSGQDPFEVPQYPVGTLPGAGYQPPAYLFGPHRSPNGMKEYTSHQFNDALFGQLLVAEFSNGDDVLAIKLDAAGNVVNVTQLASGFNNPLDVAIDAKGGVFVAEFGDQPDGSRGQVTYLKPSPGLDCSTPAARINLQPATSAVPAGYLADDGSGLDPLIGRGWVKPGTATPVSLTAQTIDRGPLVADTRLDTFINMSSPVAGAWEWTVPDPSVQYRVSVSVGDPLSYGNQVAQVNVEGVAAINAFVPTSANRFASGTVTLSPGVPADGKITLDAVGGTNTKLNYVNIDRCVPVAIDTTPPTVSIGLSGTLVGSVYTTPVTATITADDGTGSGVRTVQYQLDGGTVTNYVSPLVVTANGTHTIVATASDNAFNDSGPVTSTFTISIGAAPPLTFTSPYDVLGTGPRLVFSTVAEDTQWPAQSASIVNGSTVAVHVTGLSFAGTNAGDFQLGTGQPTAFTINRGQSVPVSVAFRPVAGTAKARFASLVVASDAPGQPTTSLTVTGTDAPGYQGGNEPSLQEQLSVLGYSTNPKRYPGQTRIPDRDEVISPYFVPVDASQPVNVVPLGHFATPSTNLNVDAVGWYPRGAKAADTTLFSFSGGSDAYGGQNQRLFPKGVTTTSFVPGGPFGLVMTGNQYSDDGFNAAGLWHNMRMYPAKTPSGAVMPGAWIVAYDKSLVFNTPADKNFDYQDVTLLITNVQPAVAAAPPLPSGGINLSFNGSISGTVADGTGQGTGFTSVQANTAGTQYDASKLTLDSIAGTLSIKSTTGTNSAKTNTQVNALQVSFDGSRRASTVSARLVGPFAKINTGKQQQAVFYGWDQDTFVRLELENASGVPALVLYEENITPGKTSNKILAGPLALANLPAAATVDLFLDVDPGAGTVSARYRINSSLASGIVALGGPFPPNIPSTVMTWFATSVTAGISVSSVTAPSFVGTYDWFSVS